MSEVIKIGGRDVPLNEILEVYPAGIKWMVVVYGESAVEIDPQSAYRIAEVAPHLVDEDIIERWTMAKRFTEAFKDY